ncbi:MAG: preprotein translocase subunit SecG [Acidobacteria bacterium]|nr:preprotein translocase subunit SecG [Acidobacteriota bacterium]
MTIILYTLFILACFVLIIAVLLQPGKSGAGDLFTSSVSSTAFGPRGTQTVLAKITVGAAAAFLLGALMIGLGVDRQGSVMEGATNPPPAATPAAQTTPPQGEAAPAASPQAEGAATTPAADALPATNASPAASPQTQASPAR